VCIQKCVTNFKFGGEFRNLENKYIPKYQDRISFLLSLRGVSKFPYLVFKNSEKLKVFAWTHQSMKRQTIPDFAQTLHVLIAFDISNYYDFKVSHTGVTVQFLQYLVPNRHKKCLERATLALKHF
jgi:hypothetical protein